MDIQQIRNATLKIVYQGKTFLIDPGFVEKEALVVSKIFRGSHT